MPRNSTLQIPARSWTEVTDGDVTSLRLQSLSPFEMTVQATPGPTAPTDDGGAIKLPAGQIIPADRSLAELWPGLSDPRRVWVYSAIATEVSVSHA